MIASLYKILFLFELKHGSHIGVFIFPENQSNSARPFSLYLAKIHFLLYYSAV